MKTIFKYFQLVFLFAWMTEGYADDIIPTYPSQASCTVSETEKQALLDFYTATDGANWKNTRANNKAWKSDIPICDWHGVTVTNGHVTRINLPNNNLNGEVPSSISNLTKLSYLALNTNRVSKLPETIGNLSELRTLALVRNNLTTLPNGIVNLPRIESLVFSTNGLSSLPAGINKLTTLKGLNLTQNKFSGNIPEEIFELVNLQTLTMRQNKLSGVISPKIGALKRLNHIDIGFNNFTGAIPKEIQNLTLLTTLKMDNNALVAIPDEIQALKAMITLELSKNQIKAIPNGITRLPRLKLLYLSNNKIQGSIPKDFVNNTALVGIYLSFNELSGTIPLELGNMPSLKTLTVDNNQLTGTVPESLAAKLSGFNFHENKLEGSIPYFTKSDLRSFSFYGNKFVFSDFENNHVSYKNRARNNYRYAPQAKVDQPVSKTIDAGQTITLSSTALTSPNNSYQWYKTVGGTTTAITGATNKNLVISNASTADAGVYHFLATNSIVTDLTLERHPITLTVIEDTCGVSEVEKQALLDFYTATGGPNWKNTVENNKPWDPAIPVCDWYGITVTNRKVVTIHLSNNNLSGHIPSGIERLINLKTLRLTYNSELSGEIPISIGKLENLRTLSLTNNNLSGAIPKELGSLTNLTRLVLNSNNLTGTIPVELGNLKKMVSMLIRANKLTGVVPKELATIDGLWELFLDGNELTGSLPSDIGRLTNLNHLSLSNNKLTGTIPVEYGGLLKLTYLALSNNKLSGVIPSEIFSIQSLEKVILDRNSFEGNIPSGISELPNLERLLINNNHFEGKLPKINSSLLRYLHIQHNDFVFSDVEDDQVYYKEKIQTRYIYNPQAKVDQIEAKNVSINQSITLTTSDLTSPNNSYQWYKTVGGTTTAITGATDKELTISNADMTDAGVYHFLATNSIVEGLTLERHPITLTVIEDTCGVSEVEKQALLDFYTATGGPNWKNTVENNKPWDPAIPVCDWYGVIVNNGTVTGLNLGRNNLSGNLVLAPLASLPELSHLSLGINNLSGEIPMSVENLFKLSYINLESNKLTGSIPEVLADLKKLSFISFAKNQLTGEILPELSALPNLKNLYLNNNQLTGGIPNDLGIITNLEYLDISFNKLSGSIPSSLGQLTKLKWLAVNNNQLEGVLPATLGQLVNLNRLYASNNQLSGELPVALGTLTALNILDLANNKLSGSIPGSLGNLTNLTNVYLNKNELSGNLPEELTRLTRLKQLFLHDNKLSGKIPAGFTNISFVKLFFNTNQFVFSDFESEYTTYKQRIQFFEYAPQAKVDQPENHIIQLGGEIILTTTDLTSPNNSYQWYKTVGGTTTAITGATDKELTISNAGMTDAGVYHFLATNSIVDGLTLERHPITLIVKEPQDCSALTCEEVIVDALNFVKNNNGITNTQVPFVLTDVPSFFDTCIDEFFKIGQEDTLVWENINGLNYSFVLRLNDAIIFKVDSSSPAMYSESIVSFSAINVANTYQEIVFINTDGVETIMRTKGFEINCNPCTDCPVGFDLCLGGNTEEYPIVYNLIPHGDHINWYLTETGGTPLEDNTPISTEAENREGLFIGGTILRMGLILEYLR
ncbi:leucine-rich repeat domain-containing protein [Aquimarina hainanensis]|uniref:leucine-rich repeat domain-containing protein n=1 Tax=Aquimarina hainanensis TaxID=1578017 RepID=UPI00361CDCC2